MQEHVEDRSGIDRWIEAFKIKPEDTAAWRARKGDRDAILRRLNVLLEDRAKLLEEAKGLRPREPQDALFRPDLSETSPSGLPGRFLGLLELVKTRAMRQC